MNNNINQITFFQNLPTLILNTHPLQYTSANSYHIHSYTPSSFIPTSNIPALYISHINNIILQYNNNNKTAPPLQWHAYEPSAGTFHKYTATTGIVLL